MLLVLMGSVFINPQVDTFTGTIIVSTPRVQPVLSLRRVKEEEEGEEEEEEEEEEEGGGGGQGGGGGGVKPCFTKTCSCALHLLCL